jgi:hypothetical protein
MQCIWSPTVSPCRQRRPREGRGCQGCVAAPQTALPSERVVLYRNGIRLRSMVARMLLLRQAQTLASCLCSLLIGRR